MIDLPFALDLTFLTGGIAGAVVFAALIFAPLFRNIALTSAALAVVGTYVQGGTSKLLAYVQPVHNQVVEQPSFAVGAVAGVLLVSVAVANLRVRD